MDIKNIFKKKEDKPASLKKRIVMCVVVTLLWLLFCLWVGSWMGLIVVPFIFDYYITKKVPWNWWRKSENKTLRAVMSWVDAIVFALVAVYFVNLYFFQNYVIPSSSLEKSLLTGDYLFVSKVSYGPRKPLTPIHMPLTSHTIPVLNCQSFSELIQWGYDRVEGIGSVEQGDIVVFNYPAGDIALANVPEYEGQDLYTLCYMYGKQVNIGATENAQESFANYVAEAKKLPVAKQLEMSAKEFDYGMDVIKNNPQQFGVIKTRPVDMREHYVKRCVGLPGQVFQIKNGVIYTDNKKMFQPTNVEYNYAIKLKYELPENLRRELGISNEDYEMLLNYGCMPLTASAKKALEARTDLIEYPMVQVDEIDNFRLYPHTFNTGWTCNNYGPLMIPKRGWILKFDTTNPNKMYKDYAMYERCIRDYEGNKLEIKSGKIYINGKPTDSYTFKMDYYWMMGDNRDNSADSRFWGFVPEDHIVGKPIFIWMSLDQDRGLFDGKIRWNRLFRWVDSMK